MMRQKSNWLLFIGIVFVVISLSTHLHAQTTAPLGYEDRQDTSADTRLHLIDPDFKLDWYSWHTASNSPRENYTANNDWKIVPLFKGLNSKGTMDLLIPLGCYGKYIYDGKGLALKIELGPYTDNQPSMSVAVSVIEDR